MRHLVWGFDREVEKLLGKPQDWNYCRYCGMAIADSYNVPTCPNCYPAYRRVEQYNYLRHYGDEALPYPPTRFDPQTGVKGPETFQPDGWKRVDTSDGKYWIVDYYRESTPIS